MIDSTNKLLMSDSLRGMVPDLEDEVTKVPAIDSVVVTVIEIADGEPLISTLDGIQIENQLIKLDVKLKLEEAYDLFSFLALDNHLKCNAVQLHLSEKMTRIVGPFRLTSPKMFGIDISNKMCVLAMDLVKE